MYKLCLKSLNVKKECYIGKTYPKRSKKDLSQITNKVLMEFFTFPEIFAYKRLVNNSNFSRPFD